jgi:hypothetical protein
MQSLVCMQLDGSLSSIILRQSVSLVYTIFINDRTGGEHPPKIPPVAGCIAHAAGAWYHLHFSNVWYKWPAPQGPKLFSTSSTGVSSSFYTHDSLTCRLSHRP